MSVRVSGLVDATPEATFAIVSDPEQDPLWREAVQSVGLIEGEARAVGALYRAHVEVMGKRIEADVRLTQIEPGCQVWYSLTKPVRAEASYTVEPDGSGTRVTFELDLSSQGGMAAVRERVIAGFVAQGAERDLRSLAGLLGSSGDGINQ